MFLRKFFQKLPVAGVALLLSANAAAVPIPYKLIGSVVDETDGTNPVADADRISANGTSMSVRVLYDPAAALLEGPDVPGTVAWLFSRYELGAIEGTLGADSFSADSGSFLVGDSTGSPFPFDGWIMATDANEANWLGFSLGNFELVGVHISRFFLYTSFSDQSLPDPLPPVPWNMNLIFADSTTTPGTTQLRLVRGILVVPEPGVLMLLCLGVAGLGLTRTRRET